MTSEPNPNSTTSDQKYIVSGRPPWYFAKSHDEVYECSDTRGLFDAVRDMLIETEREMRSKSNLGYRPRVIHKMIRDAVIRDSGRIRHKPSRSLLLALMDLVDLLGGNEFGSIATVDRAGLKHVLLIYGNYTAYYVPNEELMKNGGDRRVIPVVTQYSEKHNLLRCDTKRSMVGTYTTVLPKTGNDSRRSYFVQEVLYTPTLDSLNLLKKITGNMFEFWDMALEMPTHIDALAPSFQQIQPSQLLLTDETGSPSEERSAREALASHMQEIQPMCCAPDTGPRHEPGKKKKKRDASVDCYTEHQVRCDLTRFHYDKGINRAVYFRPGGKVLEGKRCNLVPVVALRKEQVTMRELHVSTTLRFYRALKHSCVKGNGELMGCWNETLRDLRRDTFITGQEMCQEIQHSALTAFTRRVNPSGWRNSIPRHVESAIADPVMIEVVELAIELMDARIPCAFAAAELLHCPIKTVKRFIEFQSEYASDPAFRVTVRSRLAGALKEQVTRDRIALSLLVTRYGTGADSETSIRARECATMLVKEPWEDINKIQKAWYNMCKRDEGKKDKEVYANVKVLFLRLRVYHNKIKKQGLSEPHRCDEDDDENRNLSNPTQPGPKDGNEPDDSNAAAKRGNPDGDADRPRTGVEYDYGEEGGSGALRRGRPKVYVTPEPIPASTWIKNMSTMLLSYPWLNDASSERRDAVCTLLNLDETLLNREHAELLREWVASNQNAVNILRDHNLKDRLSRSLIRCLELQSTERWKDKVLQTFPAPRKPTETGHVPDRALTAAAVKRRKAMPYHTSHEDRVYGYEYEHRLSKVTKCRMRSSASPSATGRISRAAPQSGSAPRSSCEEDVEGRDGNDDNAGDEDECYDDYYDCYDDKDKDDDDQVDERKDAEVDLGEGDRGAYGYDRHLRSDRYSSKRRRSPPTANVKKTGAPPPSTSTPWRSRSRRATRNSMCLSEAGEGSDEEHPDSESDAELEIVVRGEDLCETSDRDSSPDEYDYSDSFIDDGSLAATDISSDEDAFSVPRKGRVPILKDRAVAAQGSSMRDLYPSYSSDSEDYSRLPTRGNKANMSKQKRKRPLRPDVSGTAAKRVRGEAGKAKLSARHRQTNPKGTLEQQLRADQIPNAGTGTSETEDDERVQRKRNLSDKRVGEATTSSKVRKSKKRQPMAPPRQGKEISQRSSPAEETARKPPSKGPRADTKRERVPSKKPSVTTTDDEEEARTPASENGSHSESEEENESDARGAARAVDWNKKTTHPELEKSVTVAADPEDIGSPEDTGSPSRVRVGQRDKRSEIAKQRPSVPEHKDCTSNYSSAEDDYKDEAQPSRKGAVEKGQGDDIDPGSTTSEPEPKAVERTEEPDTQEYAGSQPRNQGVEEGDNGSPGKALVREESQLSTESSSDSESSDSESEPDRDEAYVVSM